ncbi:DBP [Siadenovirus carbocapituli]|uniref:DBP n=1 Tax=Siadenovirus sp. TaxID=2671519 RepID=A0A9E7U855_9ADEN|nr:DBP [Siadenovirus sp.]
MSTEKRPAVDIEVEPPAKKSAVEDDVELNHQRAMQIAAALSGLFGCQADINILPTADFWTKLAESFVKKNKPGLCLTVSNPKSFYHFIGRLLASFAYTDSELRCHFNALGACIWVHQWENAGSDFVMRCYHGQKMLNKPITYNFTPSSDEGARALLSGEGKLEKGKNQKDVVKLTNSENYVCPFDKNCVFPVIHTTNSCGLSFGNKNKAQAAFSHNIEWTCGMFPKARKSEIETKMIIITRCFCNFGIETIQLGRQLCKITPFEIPGSMDLDEDTCPDGMLKATAKYKTTFVFQCCNPMNLRKLKSEDATKHCDFKLSMIDIRVGMKLAKEAWNKLRETLPEQNLSQPKLELPLFSFDPKRHGFKNAIVALHEATEDDDPFC